MLAAAAAGDAAAYKVDEAATAKLRAQMRDRRAAAPHMIDRGPGYAKMLRGEFKPRI